MNIECTTDISRRYRWGSSTILATAILSVTWLSAPSYSQVSSQAKPHARPAPASAPVPPPPVVDDLTAARDATDTFLKGVKIDDLPEGKEMLSRVQWITGEADNGQNFYVRPKYTTATTIFEKLFDTDTPGVQGYKRLLDMNAVSEAGTPLLVRYIMIAYKDQHTNQWKVLARYRHRRQCGHRPSGCSLRPESPRPDSFGATELPDVRRVALDGRAHQRVAPSTHNRAECKYDLCGNDFWQAI
jgi:hypothetical protein